MQSVSFGSTKDRWEEMSLLLTDRSDESIIWVWLFQKLKYGEKDWRGAAKMTEVR